MGVGTGWGRGGQNGRGGACDFGMCGRLYEVGVWVVLYEWGDCTQARNGFRSGTHWEDGGICTLGVRFFER